MNKRVKTYYVAIFDNKVVCIDTNLKQFVRQFTEQIETEARNYDWFFREFRDGISYFKYTIGANEYLMQKIERPKEN